ncbi:hypothetical protein [Paenibacillus gansuensis]|uniref:Uncharacterized protein n=1 Tax=Paenibacillus gansuensis TaxID=306542 RepID=A0ABW5PHP3_9BACL
MTASGAFDRVLIERAKTKVQFIQLDLARRIQQTRVRAEEALAWVQPLASDAMQMDRIQQR